MKKRVTKVNTVVTDLAQEIINELIKATDKHGPMKSAHEGYAVILEELDELWEEIKFKEPSEEFMRKEAIQIAAMAMRFILDVVEKK